MAVKCYLLNREEKVYRAICRIIDRVPCTINGKDKEHNRFEFEIHCNPEHIKEVEKILAPFV